VCLHRTEETKISTDMIGFPREVYESLRTHARAILYPSTSHPHEHLPKDAMEEEGQILLLPEKDETEQEQLDQGQFPAISRRFLIKTRHVILGALVVFCCLLIPIFIVRHARTRSTVWTSCGDTPETARERGCQFDTTGWAWQTPECYDASLSAEFAEWEPWIFWTSKHGNESVPREVAYLGERSLWTTWHFHIVHCTFGWRKLHRAYEAGWIDSSTRKYEHTKHCQEMFLMEGIELDDGRVFSIDNDTRLTMANVVYPSCIKLRRGITSSSWWDSEPPR
jgi:hypothetical protein